MPSPRIAVAFAALSALSIATAAPAFAGDDEARNAAIVACKTVVAEQLGVTPADLNLDRISTRARTIELRLEARKDGARVGAADCTYARRGGATTVAVVGQAGATAASK